MMPNRTARERVEEAIREYSAECASFAREADGYTDAKRVHGLNIIGECKAAVVAAIDALVAEVREEHDNVLAVVRDVHAQRGDDVCWLDIDRIFTAAGLPVPDRAVGDKTAMLANCRRFIDVMCSGGEWKTYADLEAEIVKLKARVRRIENTPTGNERIGGGS